MDDQPCNLNASIGEPHCRRPRPCTLHNNSLDPTYCAMHPTPTHTQYTRDDRGLRHFTPIPGIGPRGGEIQVQDSSLATEPAVWIHIDDAVHTGGAIQLDRDAVHKLVLQLLMLVAGDG